MNALMTLTAPVPGRDGRRLACSAAVAVVLVALLPGAGAAQALRGTVYDEATGGVLALGEVSALAADRDTVLVRGTVERGAFHLQLPPRGRTGCASPRSATGRSRAKPSRCRGRRS
jgi:hypothetical protein